MAVITPLVDSGIAAWLKAEALFATAEDSDATQWGDIAVTSRIVSPLALKADGVAEAVRQLAFLSKPLAIDDHIVTGQRLDLLGRPIRLAGDRLGYESVPTVFVIGVTENTNGTTTLTVLKRL